MKTHFVILAVILVSLLPTVSAQFDSGNGSANLLTTCSTRELAAISGVITASTINACFTSPQYVRRSGSNSITFPLVFNVEGPDIPTGGIAAFAASYSFNPTGIGGVCSTSAWTTTSQILASGTGASSFAIVTLTNSGPTPASYDDSCYGIARMTVTAAIVPVTLATFDFPFYVQQTPTHLYNINSGTTSTTLSGTLTVSDDANGWSVVNSGTVNQVNSGTLNVVNSGGQTISISSWPQLLAQLSGGVTITDDANGWTIHQDAISGTVNVVNSGGQNVAITSWPDLVGHLDGNLDVNQTQSGNVTLSIPDGLNLTIDAWPALTADISGGLTVTDDANGWAVHQDPITGTITVNGIPDTQQEIQAVADAIELLQTINVDIVDDTMNDGRLTTGVDFNSTIENANFTTAIPDTFEITNRGTNFYLPVILWLVALVASLRYAKLVAAGVSSMGMIGAVILNGNQTVGLGIMLFALALLPVALWLEATFRERIYQRFFTTKTLRSG